MDTYSRNIAEQCLLDVMNTIFYHNSNRANLVDYMYGKWAKIIVMLSRRPYYLSF